ncbi:MAG TPA: ABC-F family ATP-binding cassette domain-containing protein [Rhodothermales bacterium]|nr:ABC-F family ATP-binding cassette domain-containing protein [Rhodothermales bacterium]
MTILALEGVSKNYGTKPLLEDVNFGLEHDEKMGIIGRNGSGKTTLLRMIAGVEPPDRGRVILGSGRTVGYVPQNPPFDPEQTVLDSVFDQGSERMRLLHDYEAACRALDGADGTDERLLARVSDLSHRMDVAGGWDLEANAKAVLDRLGITDFEQPVGELSGGQRKRVALARGLVLEPDLLILDEPTNHLDADTIAWLETYLARYTGALLLVTHDRYFLDRVTNRMLEVEGGGVQRFEGNYTYYLEKKEEQALRNEAEAQKREGLIRRELAWLRRGAKARTTKQKARIERAEALMDQPKEGPERTIDLTAASTRLGKKVVELEDVSKAYDGRTLIEDFSYRFTRGDRVGVIGPNGSGKTTLLELIAGRVQPDAGEVEIGQTAVVGYYDQESRALKDELRVIDYVKEVAENVRTADGSLITASQMLDRFLFPPAVQYSPVGKLSGGERRRLYLLRILMGAPNVLLLDEPTNDLDIPTLAALEEYLEGFAGCLVVVSHDRAFLDRAIDHLFRLEGEGRIREYPGNYSAFLEIRDREQAEQARAHAARQERDEAEPQVMSPAPDEPRKLSYKERRELEDLESRITAAEARKAEIEAEVATGGSDYDAVSTLYTELQSLTEQLDRNLERWAALAEFA